MNAKLSPDTQLLDACDIGEFEERARDAHVHMLATQLSRGQVQVRCRTRMVGDAVLSAYRVSHSLAVDWVPRFGSLNFSIQVGPCGMLFGGRERPSSSVIAYVEPASSNWTGVIPADQGTGSEAIHVSVPLETVETLEIDSKYLARGLVNLPIEKNRAREFAGWANKRFTERTSEDEERDEVLMWICEFMKPSRSAHNNIETPSYYDRIIRDVNRLADQSPAETPTVFVLATRLRVSVRTLQRAFHATFGVGVGRYLRNRRLRAAHELLQSGECAVASAAIATGFHHVARFAQQYRELYGCYPSDTMAFSR